MGFFSLLVVFTIFMVGCTSVDVSLPTQASLPIPTKTLVPTQPPVGETSLSVSTEVVVELSPTDILQPEATKTIQFTAIPSTETPRPTECSRQVDWFEYSIQRGDTLVSIANRVNATITELIEANCLNNPDRLSIGQVIYVPVAVPTTTPIPTLTPTVSTSTPVPSSRTPASAVSIRKTYTHSSDLTIEYPIDWFLREVTGQVVDNIIISSFNYTPGDEIPQNQWGENMASITLSIFNETTIQSLDVWLQEITNQLLNASNIAQVLSPVSLQTDGGITGQSIEYVTVEDIVIRNYYFIVNNRRVQVTVGGNLELAIPVINSLAG